MNNSKKKNIFERKTIRYAVPLTITESINALALKAIVSCGPLIKNEDVSWGSLDFVSSQLAKDWNLAITLSHASSIVFFLQIISLGLHAVPVITNGPHSFLYNHAILMPLF
jgi:hypothetical protein